MTNVNFYVAISSNTRSAAPSVTAWAETTREVFTSASPLTHGLNDNTKRPLCQ